MIIVDTGVLYALADRADAHHQACAYWLTATHDPVVVPSPVVAETCYLIGEYLGRSRKRSSSTESQATSRCTSANSSSRI
ncbi:MAG: PIN domain-containing protein [Nocardioidaceae bacterium]